MPIRRDEGAPLVAEVASAVRRCDRLVVAVSGGIDSMVLLDIVAAIASAKRPPLLVATFDHGTGPHSARAANLVQQTAARFGLDSVVGQSTRRGARESEWRVERWAFLRATARAFGGFVATAHTLDDHIETVFMRILREAGPRGLAGLLAESDVIRPFVGTRRAQIQQYADANGVRVVEDPSNDSREHLRNRVRLDLLPAITRVRRSFPDELLNLSRTAADWRVGMHAVADAVTTIPEGDGSLRIARSALAGYDAESLRSLWPAIAARAHVVMDRRGTHRLAEFTMKGHTGGSIQLSGGIEVRMFRDHLLLRKWDASRVELARNARMRLGGNREPASAGHG